MTIRDLTAAFPAVFDVRNPRPLAIGCRQQIAAALGKAEHRVGQLLWDKWLNRLDYLAAVAAPGSRRLNVDGSDAGEVAKEHRTYAAARLAALTARVLDGADDSAASRRDGTDN
ncbi:MAG TPA: ProQ/FINO family protein [Acidiferrobacteraceae bacterium]|nr:ProQ/FINO family protein [Acidiferrobacteraceae bacterium]